jgi:mRNA interferase MazF
VGVATASDAPDRFDVVLVPLDPTPGSEIQKAHPCVVVWPDELNGALGTLIVAPMTTAGREYPWRAPTVFDGTAGRVALDRLRTIDRARVVRRLGAPRRRHLAAGAGPPGRNVRPLTASSGR